MKILFCLDAKLIKKAENYYTTGAANFDYFNSIKTNTNDRIIVICRKDHRHYGASSKMLASGQNIEINTVNSYLELLNRNSRNKIKSLAESADSYIIKMPTILGTYLCHLLKKKNRKYTVNLVGCTLDAYRNRGIIGKIIAPLSYVITKHYVYNASLVTYVTKEYLQKKYPTKGKTLSLSDVHLGTKDKKVLEERINKINKTNLKNKIIIGTIGSLDVGYKGQEYVFNAMKKLNEKFEYQLVGSGDKERLSKIATKLGVQNDIKFLGIKSHNEVLKWLDEIDIYIQPSTVEGLCRSLLEAMSRACPCIASDAGGNPELLDPRCIFKKKDVDDICNKITYILTDLNKQAEINYKEAEKYSEQELRKKRRIFNNHLLKTRQ